MTNDKKEDSANNLSRDIANIEHEIEKIKASIYTLNLQVKEKLNELKPLSNEYNRKKFNNLKKELNTRASNCLEWDDLESWSVFKDARAVEFLRTPDLGPKTFKHIQELLIKHNLKCAINP